METTASTGWQEKLAADTDGTALKSLRDRLALARAKLRGLMGAGAAPGDYAVAEKLLAAVDAAESAALLYWEKNHK